MLILLTSVAGVARLAADEPVTGTSGRDAVSNGGLRRVVQAHLRSTVETWQIVQGGVRRAAWQNALIDLSTTLDVHAIAGGPENAFVFAQAHGVANGRRGTFADNTGGFNPVSNIMANDHVRVFDLYYGQSGAGDGWAFKAGQLAVDDDFMQSSFAGLFLNAAFGAMPSQVATPLCHACADHNAFPLYSVATPGVWLRMGSAEKTSWQMGIYHGAPGSDSAANHGFNWGSGHESGVLVFAEGRTHHAIAGLPLTSAFGVSVHSGKVDDYRGIRSGSEDAHIRGLYSLYVVEDVVLSVDAAAQPKVAAFARYGVVPAASRTVVDAYADFGLNWLKPFGSDRADVIGFGASATRFAKDFRAVVDYPRSQTAVELTYKVPITRTLTVQADAQRIFNPASTPAPVSAKAATILGVRASFSW